MRKSEQTDKITKALISVQAALEAVPKRGKNPFFNDAPFVKLGDALAEAVPKLNAQEIFLSQTIDNNCLLTTLLHTSGQWIESAVPIINKKGDDQGQGGSISYTRRYGLLSILGIPTEDDDGNIASKKSHQDEPSPPRSFFSPGAVDEILKQAQKPQSNKWADYTLKTGKKTKGQTIRSIGIDGAMNYRNFLDECFNKNEREKKQTPKSVMDDLNALSGFQQECADANGPKVFRGNETPPTTEYKELRHEDAPWPEEPA